MEIALDFVKFVGDSMISPFKGHFIEQDDNVQTRGNSFQTVSTIAPAFGNDEGIINTQELETTKSMQISNEFKDKSKESNEFKDKSKDKIKISMPTNVSKRELYKEEQITNITQGRY